MFRELNYTCFLLSVNYYNTEKSKFYTHFFSLILETTPINKYIKNMSSSSSSSDSSDDEQQKARFASVVTSVDSF